MKFGRASVLVLVGGLVACGGKSVSRGSGGTTAPSSQTETELCVSLCDKSEQCPDTASGTANIDCGTLCTAYENIARKGGCPSALSQLFSCYSGGDTCGSSTVCNDDANRVGQCLAAYCTAEQTDPDCVTLISQSTN